jgi:hypothetical protein
MTEPTDRVDDDRGVMAKAGALAAAGGRRALNGLKWLAPRAKRASGKVAAGIGSAASGLASRLKKARSKTDETS